MAKQLQIRGGTTVQHSTFTGALREITIDTDKDVVVVHDGTTVGGFPLAKQTSVDAKVAKVTSTDNAVVRFNGTTGEVQNSGVIIDDNSNVGIGGNLLLTSGTGALGYGAGAGGTVTQLTSKSTAVTLNKPSGRIATHTAALAAGSEISFTFNNSIIKIDASAILLEESFVGAFPNKYSITSKIIADGSCFITIKNNTAGSLSEAIYINYIIIRGTIA